MSLIDVSHLSFAYDGGYDYIFRDVSFQIDTDWRLGFTGRNGRGKTTFLKLLLGEYDYQGTISASVDFEYFPYPVPDPDANTGEALAGVCPDAPEWKLRRELGRLGVDEGVLYRPFSTLSNGEQTKSLLAALFLRENAFLLIDEPTNHLDMRGRALVSAYLAQKKGYVLVSHDRAFLDGCVDHILSINRADIQVCRGNFSVWWENKQRQDRLETKKGDPRPPSFILLCRCRCPPPRSAGFSAVGTSPGVPLFPPCRPTPPTPPRTARRTSSDSLPYVPSPVL